MPMIGGSSDRTSCGYSFDGLSVCPLCRPLGDGLWELRCDLSSNRIARLFFCFTQERLVALHGFVKKARKTPEHELEIARKRRGEFR